jgi:aspartyl-tRNA(Asn)/glutamyl-tRNA(Gln) amidotransferase subunit A
MPQDEARQSCRDKLEATFARIEAVGDKAIFTRLYADSARSAADAADKRRRSGSILGPLDGCIVTIKDLFDVAGEPTTAGSAMLRDAAPAAQDAAVVRRLRAAGAVILGKTNMTEFAYSGLGLNPHWGTPGNAASPDRVPGGSSSGAGVSVALGMGDIAIGSDTGGSVRIPAALNGVVGFKPTADRVPRDGVFPLSYSLDSIGPLARSVQTCADTDAIMAGDRPSVVEEAPLAGLRLGVTKEYLEGTDPAILEVFNRVLRGLERAGAIVREIDLGSLLADMRRILGEAPIVPVEAAEIHAERVATNPRAIDPNVLDRILQGPKVSGPNYLASIRSRHRLIAAMDERLEEWDCLVLPTTPVPAPLISEVADRQAFHRMNLLILRNPSFVNFFDLCAISLPMPIAPLPAGIMFAGRHDRDARLLSIARGVENNLPLLAG